jgi:hypothetical protein
MFILLAHNAQVGAILVRFANGFRQTMIDFGGSTPLSWFDQLTMRVTSNDLILSLSMRWAIC